MKGFFNKLFRRNKQEEAPLEKIGHKKITLKKTEGIDKQIDALYGVLVDIFSSEKLVLRAGKLDAMDLAFTKPW